jgi:hypothetical protein
VTALRLRHASWFCSSLIASLPVLSVTYTLKMNCVVPTNIPTGLMPLALQSCLHRRPLQKDRLCKSKTLKCCICRLGSDVENGKVSTTPSAVEIYGQHINAVPCNDSDSKTFTIRDHHAQEPAGEPQKLHALITGTYSSNGVGWNGGAIFFPW